MRGFPQHILLLFYIMLLLCTGCEPQSKSPITPSPTIIHIQQTATPQIAHSTTRMPTMTSSPASLQSASNTPTAMVSPITSTTISSDKTQFSYLWPIYLPYDLQLSPEESRVAREGELGDTNIGFFIITFQSGAKKLVIGGGATETLPLTGTQTQLTIGTYQTVITTNDEQRQIVFDVTPGHLFIYGFGISEEELVHVAKSLSPIDAHEMRTRVGMR